MKETRTINFRFAPERPQCCIGLVDDMYKTVIREDGSVNFAFDSRDSIGYYTRCDDKVFPIHDNRMFNYGFHYRYKPVFTHRDTLCSTTQDFGDPSAAIVTTVEDYKASRLTWTAFAWMTSENARVDVVIWKLEAKENMTTTRSSVVLAEMGKACDGSFVIKTAVGRKTKSNPDVKPYHFAAGEVKEGVFFFVQKGGLPDEWVTLDGAQDAFQWAIEYWKNFKPFQKRFEIPDGQIMDMLKSCGRNILQAREVHEKVYTFQVGPTVYRGLWFVDGHFILESAHIMGRHDEAYAGMLTVLANTHPDGSIQIMDKHDKETGIAIATVVRQCEIMGDDARLRELWPVLRRALAYIRTQRAQARALGDDYPGCNLFPPCFGDGGIYLEPEYTTPLWVMHGLKAAYDAGKRLDLPNFGEFKAEFDDLMETFLKAAKRDYKTTAGGIPYLPMSMLTEEQVQQKIGDGIPEEYQPQTGIWAFSQAIYPGEIFEPDHFLVQNLTRLLDSIDDRQGIPEKTGWMPHDGIWPYASMFDAHVWLYSGHGGKAADYLYAFANHAGPARTWREEQALAGNNSGEMCGDMPHNWGSAMFIYLTRNLIVFEKRGNLEIFAGLPEEWLPDEESGPLVLEETPTRYGKVSIHLEKKDDGKYLLRFNRFGSRDPQKILLHWTGQVDIDAAFSRENGLISLDGQVASFTAILA
jgi:hypothetical protein